MLWKYLRSRAPFVLALMLFALIFALVFALCALPLDAVAYAALVCAASGLPLLLWDYLRFLQRMKLLSQLKTRPEDAANALPAPTNELERAYQEIIRAQQLRRIENERQSREALTARGDYYTVWAHQIKTPIAAMRLILQDMDGADIAALRGELKRIEQYADMALCYIRLDSPDTDYLFRRCDLDALLRAQLRSASPLFIRSRLQLSYEPLNYSALTDEKWLSFVIGQILSNSLKYTPPGGRIEIRMPEAGVLAICDTGIGIPAEDLPRVTQSGFTGQNGRDDKRATGLGLYLCRRILERLGHELRIESERGAGTRVYIDLRTLNY